MTSPLQHYWITTLFLLVIVDHTHLVEGVVAAQEVLLQSLCLVKKKTMEEEREVIMIRKQTLLKDKDAKIMMVNINWYLINYQPHHTRDYC